MSFCFTVDCIAAVDPAAASFAALALSWDESVRTREKNRRLGGFPSRLRKEGSAGTGLGGRSRGGRTGSWSLGGWGCLCLGDRGRFLGIALLLDAALGQ
jgi:hypothetical protein